jgi:hypothetical protein
MENKKEALAQNQTVIFGDFLRRLSDYRSMRQCKRCWRQLPATFGHTSVTVSATIRGVFGPTP